MSIKVTSSIWDQSGLDPFERLVLLCLADHADDDGRSWPSVARICERTGMKERGAQNVLRRLVNRGILTVETGGGRSRTNAYIIGLNPASDAPLDAINPAPDAPLNPAPDAPFEGETPHPITETPHSTTLNPALNAPEPKRTKENQEKKESARDALALVIGSELADAFVSHRRALRSPMTPHAGKLMAKRLASMSDPGTAVETAIERGWKTAYPETNFTPPRRGSNGPTLDDHLDALKARLVVQRLE